LINSTSAASVPLNGLPFDDRHLTAADQLLELGQREVGLDPGGVAIHREADRLGRGQRRCLGILSVGGSATISASATPRPMASAISAALVRLSVFASRSVCSGSE